MTPSQTSRVALVILDGWGIGSADESDAIAAAKTPCMDHLLNSYAHATLRTDGEFVGLPDGQMGNSEVGHMNIGAGRVVYQDLLRINKAISSGDFYRENVLLEALSYAKSSGKKLHLMGLVSQGGVHSQQEHLHAICRTVQQAGISDFGIHAFTDGRDTSPQLGRKYISNLEEVLKETGGRIVSVHGRYYAMDRDNRWQRIAKSYDTLTRGQGEVYATADEGIAACYEKGITDEFIEPFVVQSPYLIEPGDAVICFNFRTDRCREITTALTQKAFSEFNMAPLDLHYVTMTNYDDTFQGVRVIYDKPNLEKTLGEVISQAGRSQIRIAETEKYPHVTFFFSGGREEPFEGERRLMAHSPKVPTYDLQPEMSADEIVALITPEMRGEQGAPPDFICLNFANPDMVGHTGVFEAIVKAVETTDRCLQEVLEAGVMHDYQFIIIADHGNADYARHPDGSPHTAHTTNPVPIIGISPEISTLHHGILADVAPTILKMLNIQQPAVMSGKPLF